MKTEKEVLIQVFIARVYIKCTGIEFK